MQRHNGRMTHLQVPRVRVFFRLACQRPTQAVCPPEPDLPSPFSAPAPSQRAPFEATGSKKTARFARVLAPVLALVLATLGWLPTGAQAQEGQPQLNLPRTRLSAGMHQIDAQVAATPEQRQIGLMFRRDMPTHEGMLFVFEQPGVQCFWMKNTLLPLTAAFLADDGTIVNLADMKPQSLDSHCSAKPVRFVLEMKQGWFAQRAIRPGAKLSGAPFATR